MDPITFTCTRPSLDDAGLARLGAAWRGLEASAGASPFQRWSWVGCRAAERFPDPVLAQAHRGRELLGMALFNRHHGRLWLHESGDPALDSIYVEHNGALVRAGPDRSAVTAGLLACTLRSVPGRVGGVVLSGVGDDVLAAARSVGAASSHQARAAPFVDLSALPAGTDYPAALSRNTRQQLRRSARAYGDARLDRAATAGEAMEYLDGLAALHTSAWQARGKPGAFAQAGFLRFHRELVAEGAAAGHVDLLRITAGPGVVGYLYNLRAGGLHAEGLRAGGRVCAYQSGFDYAAAPPHGKPGLLCHHLAIEAARARGDAAYDFLAGDGRYKDSLSNACAKLHWLRLLPRWHPRALMAAALGR